MTNDQVPKSQSNPNDQIPNSNGGGDNANDRAIEISSVVAGYSGVLADVVGLLETGRRSATRAVNAAITTTYWHIGRRVVDEEQDGRRRAGYGRALIQHLATELTRRFGRGVSERNLDAMRLFYMGWKISQTSSAKFVLPNVSDGEPSFPLPWSHYVQLMRVDKETARQFYETEALRGGWTVKQLRRQIDTKFYDRALLSKNKAAMLTKHAEPQPEDLVTVEEQVKDPFVLEFRGLKDEYSEFELEESLIRHLEMFLLELGNDFTFVGRQRRLRVGDSWYRIDLLLFHRRLRSLVIVDLKIGAFTHADAGQMHLYCNYAGEHWTNPGENPPVGLILCTSADAAVVKYSLDNLPNPIMASEYRLALPDEAMLAAELEKTRRVLTARTQPQTDK